jgi:hypothetical protein
LKDDTALGRSSPWPKPWWPWKQGNCTCNHFMRGINKKAFYSFYQECIEHCSKCTQSILTMDTSHDSHP